MQISEIAQEALRLPATARFELVDLLMQSLDKPDPEIDRIWGEEAVRRLEAHRRSESAGIPMEAIFDKNQPRVLVKATTST